MLKKSMLPILLVLNDSLFSLDVSYENILMTLIESKFVRVR